jgi:hypothetical protein
VTKDSKPDGFNSRCLEAGSLRLLSTGARGESVSASGGHLQPLVVLGLGHITHYMTVSPFPISAFLSFPLPLTQDLASLPRLALNSWAQL